MDAHSSAFIHKEKEAKRKQKTEAQLSIVQGSTHVKSIFEQRSNVYLDKGQKLLAKRDRNRKLLLNAEIDDYIEDWIRSGLMTEQWSAWVAKACHTIGLAKVNKLAIKARDGKQPARLFAVSIKANVNLHYKRLHTPEL